MAYWCGYNRAMQTGRFITFEGGEGTGKSTQVKLLGERLNRAGFATVITREPGGSPFAERVRDVILDPQTPPHSALSEALLFYAARADHLEKRIRPARSAGQWVISDRFSDSTRVYQTLAGGLPLATFETLERLVVGDARPDLTLLLDLPAELGLERARQRRESGGTGPPSSDGARAADAYEARDISFHARLRDGFLALARAEPDRCVVIDARQPIDAIADAVWAAVRARLTDRVA